MKALLGAERYGMVKLDARAFPKDTDSLLKEDKLRKLQLAKGIDPGEALETRCVPYAFQLEFDSTTPAFSADDCAMLIRATTPWFTSRSDEFSEQNIQLPPFARRSVPSGVDCRLISPYASRPVALSRPSG